MLNYIKSDREFLLSLISMFLTFVLILVGILKSFLHDEKFLYALIILSLFSPSPYRLYLKIKDLIEIGKNGNSNSTQNDDVTKEIEESCDVNDGELKDITIENGDGMEGEESGGKTKPQVVRVRVFEER